MTTPQPHTAEILKRIISKFAVPLRRGPQLHPRLAALYARVAIFCHDDMDDLHRFRFPPKKLDVSECPPIYLKPVEDEAMIPILRLAYDFTNESHLELAARIVLVKLHLDSLCAIGFRFESGAGAHAYFHCQLTRGFEKDDNFDTAMPDWIPQTLPAFCLDANRPIHLLAACFISIYGLTEWNKDIRADSWLMKTLRKVLKGMHLYV